MVDADDDNDDPFEDCAWEERDKAVEAVKDLLPTQEEFEERYRYHDFKPSGRLLADESRVVAFLKCKSDYGRDTIEPFLVVERSFLASCSSSWGSGLIRYPGCPLSSDLRHIYPGGACDPFEEITHAEIREGILVAKARIGTGVPQPAGRFGVMVMELHNAYQGGWQITPEFFRRLGVFREHTGSYRLNQCGYQVINKRDDHAVLILPSVPNNYDQYLLGNIKELHKEAGGITLGVSMGDVYYWSQQEVFSDAVNRLWLQMRNLSSGAVVLDGTDGAKVAGRIGLGDKL